jgi:hypothetical protein
MNDMAEEFGGMLQETLDKMKERIEVNASHFDTGDLNLQQRFEEIN